MDSSILCFSSNLKFRIVIVFQNRRMPREEIYYSDKYTDDTFEYRHVIVPKKIAR